MGDNWTDRVAKTLLAALILVVVTLVALILVVASMVAALVGAILWCCSTWRGKRPSWASRSS